MSDYSQTTDFSAKDALTTGDPDKIISGADVDVELAAISTAIASKIDEPSSPSANDILRWTGAAWSADPLPQIAVGTYSTYASITAAIPSDDSIPQNTEGTEIVTATIIPVSTTSKLLIRATVPIQFSAAATAVIALFQDSTADALAASYFAVTAAAVAHELQLTHVMDTGTVSSTTFKIRAGITAGTLYVNGNSSGRLYGGVMAANLTVIELPG